MVPSLKWTPAFLVNNLPNGGQVFYKSTARSFDMYMDMAGFLDMGIFKATIPMDYLLSQSHIMLASVKI